MPGSRSTVGRSQYPVDRGGKWRRTPGASLNEGRADLLLNLRGFGARVSTPVSAARRPLGYHKSGPDSMTERE
jgi:hypothetical protein